MLAVNTLAFWMPTLIHGAGVGSDGKVGLLSAVPYLAGCFFIDRLRALVGSSA